LHPKENDSSHVAFHIEKRYRRFCGAAAINDWSNGLPISLTFRIMGDGRELWKSSPLQAASASEPFDVDVAGIGKLELLVDCPGSNFNAHSVWVEPRLER
jgi:alpha-galactosidase